MAYFAPYIDAAGLHIPTYDDILAYMIEQYQTIYGQGAYLAPDSADYQWLSINALQKYDNLRAVQLVYNNRGPLTAIGAGLDQVVKLNGIARKVATPSTCQVTLTGTAGAVITNGLVQDVNGNYWALPASVTIGGGGTVTVTATCQVAGAISASIGQINIIATPQAGWLSVTNAVIAAVGVPVEADSQLRARQALSVALPSQTRFDGTVAAIATLTGVTRYLVLENPTGAVDIYGNPPHSITAVVEGGTDDDVALAIYLNKSIGCYTNGTVTVPVYDPVTNFPMPIRFDRPTYVQVVVSLQIHLLGSASTQVLTDIQNAAVNYLNSLEIGELLTVSGLYAACMAVNPNLSNPLFSIRGLGVVAPTIIIAHGLGNPGSGYVVGDQLIANQAGSSNAAVFEVTSIGGGGAIATLALIQNGTDYLTQDGVPLVGGNGAGATVNLTAGIGPTTENISGIEIGIHSHPYLPFLYAIFTMVNPTSFVDGNVLVPAGLTAVPALNGVNLIVDSVPAPNQILCIIPNGVPVTAPFGPAAETGSLSSNGTSEGTLDIGVAFNEVTEGVASNVTIVQV